MRLSQQLLAEQTRLAVIEDLVAVVRQEVAAKKGVSGAALEAGMADGHVRAALPRLGAALRRHARRQVTG